MKRWLLVCAALVLGSIPMGSANPVSATFAKANADFADGDYQASITAYTQIAEDSPSAEVYCNLGSAYEASGDVVNAILNYQRALILDPGLTPARARLMQIQSNHGITPRPHGWADDVTRFVHPETLTIAGTTIGWIGILGLGYFFFGAPSHKRWMVLAGAAFLLGSALFGVGMVSDPRLSDQNLALVSGEDPAEVRVQPASNSNPIAALPPGTAVGVVSPRGAWTFCELPSGAKGWIATDQLIAVEPGVSL